MKLAIVTNILPPYRVPLFNQLARQPRIDLRVFLCGETEPNRHWEWPADIRFVYEVGSTVKWSPRPGKTFYVNPRLTHSLRRFRPDAVIAGGTTLVGLAAWAGAKLSGAVFVLWSEATLLSERHRPPWSLPLRRFLVRHAQAYVASSSPAADYFSSLGADPEYIRVSLLTLDVKSFGQEVQEHRQERELLKHNWGLSGPVVSYFGNLEPWKGPDLLVKTYLNALSSCADAELLLVGSGTMTDELKALGSSVYGARVHFAGFVQHRDLPAYYAVTDLFCLFSLRDSFGIVVTEAIAAGLPVMCSKFAGAAYDLVEHGQNGFVIDPEDIGTDARLMSEILTDNSLRARMAEQSGVIAQKCTVEQAAAAMLDAVRYALGSRKAREGFA